MGNSDFLNQNNDASALQLTSEMENPVMGNISADAATDITTDLTTDAPTENVDQYEEDVFRLIYDAIPYYMSNRLKAELFTGKLTKEKGAALVEVLNMIHRGESDGADTYTEKTAGLFSVKRIILADKKNRNPYELTRIIFPPAPEPQKKFTSCIRAYICCNKSDKTYRFITVETNKMLPSYALCEAERGRHSTLHFFEPCPPEQDIVEIAKELGASDLCESEMTKENEWNTDTKIKELKEAKKEILVIYEAEKSKLGRIIRNPFQVAKVERVEKEISKIDSLIEILKRDDIEYVVMKLERLYMQVLSNRTEEEFDKLPFNKKSDLFIELFPMEWAISVAIEKKRELLVEAIIDNKRITRYGG